MQHIVMKSVVSIIFFAVIAASMLASANGQTCTNSTCPEGVVITQYFTTIDCSGAYTLSAGSNYSVPCTALNSSAAYNSSQKFTCDDASVTLEEYAGSAAAGTCAASTSIRSAHSTTRLCIPTGGQSSAALWCSAAEATSMTPEASPSVMTTANNLSVANCSLQNGCGDQPTLWIYTASDCRSESLQTVTSPMSLFDSDATAKTGVCYTTNLTSNVFDDRKNIQVSCGDGFWTMTTSLGGCGATGVSQHSGSVPIGKCSQLTATTWGKLTCTGHSAGSMLVASPIFIVLALALLLVF